MTTKRASPSRKPQKVGDKRAATKSRVAKPIHAKPVAMRKPTPDSSAKLAKPAVKAAPERKPEIKPAAKPQLKAAIAPEEKEDKKIVQAAAAAKVAEATKVLPQLKPGVKQPGEPPEGGPSREDADSP